MSVIWHKVAYDFWERKGRTLLAILSIASGVFAIGTIFGMMDQLLSSLDAAHNDVQPAHINLILRQPVDWEIIRSVEDIEGVAGIEPVNGRSIRYKSAAESPWSAGSMVMRYDYANQSFDRLILKEGRWPQDDELAVERLSSDYFGVEIGDEVILELDGTDRAFPIVGKVRHPLVAPPDFGGEAYFFMDDAGMERMGIPKGRFVQLLAQVSPYSEDYAKDRVTVIKDKLARQGVGVGIVIYQKPDEHWGRNQLAGLNYVLQILAVVSLFASVVIVVNTMTAIITQQTDQIGVIKAIGGASNVILKIYLAGAVLFGVLALGIALPLGMWAAFAGTQTMLNFFNVDYDQFTFSTRAVWLQILAATIAPLAAAMLPVWSGAKMSVREAIATYGIGADFGGGWIDRLVEKVGGRFLSAPYAIALGNMFRRKGRLTLTQAVLAVAGMMFIMTATLSDSLNKTLENELARRRYDIRLFLNRTQRSDQVIKLIESTPGVAQVESWLTIQATVAQQGKQVEDTAGLGAELYGIPAASQMYQPNITSGRWLRPDDAGKVVVISKESADFNDVQVGEIITIDLGELGDDEWLVIGTYRTVAAEPFTTDPIYAPHSAVSAVTGKVNRTTQIVVRASDPAEEATNELMASLKSILNRRNIETNPFFSRTKGRDREVAANQFSILNAMLLGLSGVMGVVGGIGLMGSLSISVVERTREIGVLRAIGARSSTIVLMFVMEGALQALLSWLVAVPLAWLVSRPVTALFGETVAQQPLDFVFAYWAVALWLVGALLIGILAACLPALSATKVSVQESLAYA